MDAWGCSYSWRRARLTIVTALGLLLFCGRLPAEPPSELSPPPPSGGVDVQAAVCCPECVDWSKIPSVRPLPRPGFFLIPPASPGYYSLRDMLECRWREKPPLQPWGFFGAYMPGFYDTDFRYLDKPDNQQHDFWDPLKRIHLGDDWLLSVGSQTWSRYMNEVDSRLTAANNTYDLFRTRLYGDLWYRDKVRLFAEYIYAESFWQDLPPLPIDINRSDLLDLFVELNLGEWEGKPAWLRIGRQEMLLGSQRLISTLDWANTRRTFQGVRAYRQGEEWDVDLFWVQPVAVNRNYLDSPDNNQNFAGGWVTYRPKKGAGLDFYYLILDQTSPVVLGENGKPGGFTVNTLGSRSWGDFEHWLWDVEGMLQFGTYSNQDLLAGAFTVGGGYHFADWPMNPQWWVYFDFASGDSTPGVGGKRSTFNQLFPFGHYYFGYLDLVGRQNIHDLNTQIAFFPLQWVTCLIQFHHFRLDTPRDALYSAAGRPLRQDPTGRAGTQVGNELDLAASFHLGTHTDLLIGWSKLFAGSFIERTGPKVSPELFYLQVGYRW
jgi:hypothetical protein